MDAIAERPVATHEPPGETGAPPDARRTLRWLALPPVDATPIARQVDALQLAGMSGASIVVVDAIAKLSVPALARIRAFLVGHPGAAAVVVDRLDDAGCEYVVFDAQRRRLTDAGIAPDIFVPAISSSGEGVVSGADRIEWYRGPTLVQWLGSLPPQPATRGEGSPS